MEMQEVAKEGERGKEDEGASESMVEVKTKEEAEPETYRELQSPPEDIYSEALVVDSRITTRSGKNTRLYRAACLFLTITCLVLLLVVIILSVKLQAVTGETTTTDRQGAPLAPRCSHDECQALFHITQAQRCACRQCADGWLPFGRSCFYLSTHRLSWDESQRNCSASGGALAVVNNRRVQNFLTAKGKMMYWIGLRQKGATWTWVDKTVLIESYWTEGPSDGDCGILSHEKPPEKNWIKDSCQSVAYFICQLEL
ncbi:C-type lectin domain family 17, member A isoform X1 [Pungitius pungitius]|uniref:C-type lectin domain family 17, member A isoform X1 n=1 Tax=Pungitius pungitius TaxID=134920 RepID=UPI002E10F4AA